MSEEDKLIEKYKKDRESIDILQCRFLIDYYQDLYQQEKEKNKQLEIEITKNDYVDTDKLAENYRFYKNLAYEYQGNSISKDKIRAKIKEIKAKKDFPEFADYEWSDTEKILFHQADILEDLLEEE